jgi:hypothetical protein
MAAPSVTEFCRFALTCGPQGKCSGTFEDTPMKTCVPL